MRKQSAEKENVQENKKRKRGSSTNCLNFGFSGNKKLCSNIKIDLFSHVQQPQITCTVEDGSHGMPAYLTQAGSIGVSTLCVLKRERESISLTYMGSSMYCMDE